MLCGALILVSARLLLPAAREIRPLGELRTPILAGATVVLAVLIMNPVVFGLVLRSARPTVA